MARGGRKAAAAVAAAPLVKDPARYKVCPVARPARPTMGTMHGGMWLARIHTCPE